MPALASPSALGKLDALRAELAELAFSLERRGRWDAADVANVVATRVGECRDELAGAETDTEQA